MNRKINTAVMVAGLLLGSNAFAGIDNMTIKVGGANTSIESVSSTGFSVGGEWSFIGNAQKRTKKGYDIYADIGYDSTDSGYVTKAAIGGRYNVGANIWLGALAGVSGVSVTNNNNSTDFSGFMFGANAKYEITPNHGVLVEYRSASVSPSDTTLVAVDVNTVSAYYSYSF